MRKSSDEYFKSKLYITGIEQNKFKINFKQKKETLFHP